MKLRLLGAACLTLLIGGVRPAGAWGPHSEITRAAVDVLPASDRLEERLGRVELQRYSWLPDYRDAVLPDYSPNDYLLFPEFPRHVSHLTPDVRGTYRPFFRRALQALRTESRTNAARWTGSLLHFVQDSLSPPHALPTSGALHFRMENWVDAERITLDGYRPRRLGSSVDAALERLDATMVQRIAASRVVGERLRPLCEREDRAGAEPLVLQAALESARASADLLHTLLGLESGRDRRELARLEVYVRAPKDSARPLAPARLRLLNTPWSTFSEQVTEATADYYRGLIVLRNVPPGEYEAEVSRPGAAPHRARVCLRNGEAQRLTVTLAAAG
jgi:hypothetical protein